MDGATDKCDPVRSPPLAPPGRDTQGRVCLMTLDNATELVRQTLILALLVSAPMLLIGLVVGIVVSLLQAVTQIQEQTLTFVPKIAAMVGAAVLLMPWIGHHLLEYAADMFRAMQQTGSW